MKKDKLLYLATAIMFLCVAVSAFTLWYVYSNKDAISGQIRDSLREELKNYNVPIPRNATIGEAEAALVVAKYCATKNDCQGPKGDTIRGKDAIQYPPPKDGQDAAPAIDGKTPSCYFAESRCVGRDGYTPQKNVDYFDGAEGKAGADAREVERQCNGEKSRMEWKLSGDSIWQPEYNLAPGQTCVVGGL